MYKKHTGLKNRKLISISNAITKRKMIYFQTGNRDPSTESVERTRKIPVYGTFSQCLVSNSSVCNQ